MSKSYHVVKAINHWAVKNKGLTLSAHNTQRQAIELGKVIAKLTQGELFIHGQNGRIREKNNYGSDPFPSRG